MIVVLSRVCKSEESKYLVIKLQSSSPIILMREVF